MEHKLYTDYYVLHIISTGVKLVQEVVAADPQFKGPKLQAGATDL